MRLEAAADRSGLTPGHRFGRVALARNAVGVLTIGSQAWSEARAIVAAKATAACLAHPFRTGLRNIDASWRREEISRARPADGARLRAVALYLRRGPFLLLNRCVARPFASFRHRSSSTLRVRTIQEQFPRLDL